MADTSSSSHILFASFGLAGGAGAGGAVLTVFGMKSAGDAIVAELVFTDCSINATVIL
jgi:hypothetical protein